LEKRKGRARGLARELANIIATEPKTRSEMRVQCGVGRSASRLIIEGLLADGFSAQRISDILRERKLGDLPYDTIGRHARKSCRCSSKAAR